MKSLSKQQRIISFKKDKLIKEFMDSNWLGLKVWIFFIKLEMFIYKITFGKIGRKLIFKNQLGLSWRDRSLN